MAHTLCARNEPIPNPYIGTWPRINSLHIRYFFAPPTFPQGITNLNPTHNFGRWALFTCKFFIFRRLKLFSHQRIKFTSSWYFHGCSLSWMRAASLQGGTCAAPIHISLMETGGVKCALISANAFLETKQIGRGAPSYNKINRALPLTTLYFNELHLLDS